MNIHKVFGMKAGSHLLFEGDDYSVHALVEPCGMENPIKMHHHSDWDESWQILKGSYEININGNQFSAYAGDFIEVDRNVPHSVRSIHGNSIRLSIFKKNVEIIYED